MTSEEAAHLDKVLAQRTRHDSDVCSDLSKLEQLHMGYVKVDGILTWSGQWRREGRVEDALSQHVSAHARDGVFRRFVHVHFFCFGDSLGISNVFGRSDGH